MRKEMIFLFAALMLSKIVNSMYYWQEQHSMGYYLADPFDMKNVCSKSGVTCEDCLRPVKCIRLPTGWYKINMKECSADRPCNARLGGCSVVNTPECSQEAQRFEHICMEIGVFPDAYDCRKFHMCSPPQDILSGKPLDHRPVFCPRSYAYDANTAQCSIKLNDHSQCESKPVTGCEYIGQTGPVLGSRFHYFICLFNGNSIYPQIIVCPNGYHFYNNSCNPNPTIDVALSTNDKKDLLYDETTITVTFDEESSTTTPESSLWSTS